MAIEFTNKPIKWTNEGTAPSEDLKTNGFQAGYKPPAAVFNNQWHATGECIDELQTKLSSTDDKKVDKVTGKSLIDTSVANKFSEETTIPNGVKLDGNLIINNTVAATGEVAIREYSQGLNGYTFTHKLSEKANTTDVLTKTNTTEFTPTGDYHPATKKYVDDNKIAIIDDLNTMSNVAALSAYQGKVLKDKITALPIKSLAGQMVQPTSSTQVTAKEGATIIGDTSARTYDSGGTILTGNVATGKNAIAIGTRSTASSSRNGFSIAIGTDTSATADNSFAMGYSAFASAPCSVAMGRTSEASGMNSVAMGQSNAGGANSVAMGQSNAGGMNSVAIGQSSADGNYAASFGSGTASGDYSISACNSTSSGKYSAAFGCGNNALDYQTKVGKYAKAGTAGLSTDNVTGDAFIIGNGTSTTSLSNAFRVTYTGKAYGLSAYGSSGADYAEYFEWKDGNPNNEDRRGRLVTLDGEKIRLATVDDDYILGVVSANPCIEGDVYSDDWQGKYLTDVFGQRLTQTVHIPARYEEQEIADPETGETTTENVLIEDEHDAVQWVLNPDYDPEQEYVSREDRKEWSAIGLMGKLVVVDDGTCEVNGYCKAGVNGIATKANDGYRVMARIDDTHIRVLVR